MNKIIFVIWDEMTFWNKKLQKTLPNIKRYFKK